MYVPGTKLTNDGIYEGLIKGEQNLVRGQIDTYRTILELFDLPRKQDFYMGVHLFSQEPSYVIDNKLLDVVVDEGLFSMRDIENKFPSTYHVSDALYKHIRTQKLLNDLLYKDPHLEERVNQYFNRIKRESI